MDQQRKKTEHIWQYLKSGYLAKSGSKTKNKI